MDRAPREKTGERGRGEERGREGKGGRGEGKGKRGRKGLSRIFG